MKSKLSSKATMFCSLSAVFSSQSNSWLFDNSLFVDNVSDSKKRQPHRFSGVSKQKRLAQKRKNKRK
tara:strand:+ start:423 stop:623 length:201 start_codon:yes stop_codon:yes gene_type:complete